MNLPNLLQYALFLAVIIACVKPVGLYLFRVFEGQATWLDPVLRPIERLIYWVARVNPQVEMNWKQYAIAFTAFSLLGTGLLVVILMLQPALPWYDSVHLTTPMTFDLALNTAISFATTTTWQAYAGETTMSYFSQMVGLVAQNFLAGAAGLAVGIAFMRGLTREQTTGLGNFWVDLTRAMLWVLLPLAIIGGVILVWQGVPMNFNAYTDLTTVQGNPQSIAQGPVAALETIKNLGTNGGGFFNVNAAHPYENPTPLTNLVELLMIAVLPASLTYTFGRMANKPWQGWLIFWVMTVLFMAGLLLGAWAEQSGNPLISARGVDLQASNLQSGGNLEGKEIRFGVHGSVLAAITTSNGATGSYNSMHDSYTPLGGMIPLVNMMLGEVIYGGLGTGFYSMAMLVLLSVFIGGLMVGHTPSYLGKQVTIAEIKVIGLYTIVGAAAVLLLTAVAVISEAGRAGLTTNQGAHGFTEILYAYASSLANNGQNFAGLSANSVFYNVTTAIAMLIGRFGLTALALALAGYFVEQRRRVISSGTLATDTLTFAILLTATTVIVGALSYLPALALGPMIEHLLMTR
ncbi:MAG: potassium-transporting ATPase subunit KdpA [Armatimonadetes bacterium]|nr:potassium-transporting ATPase subunit KdpA [Anaerolineae bacterium]